MNNVLPDPYTTIEVLRARLATAEASYQEAQITIAGLEAEVTHHREAAMNARAVAARRLELLRLIVLTDVHVCRGGCDRCGYLQAARAALEGV